MSVPRGGSNQGAHVTCHPTVKSGMPSGVTQHFWERADFCSAVKHIALDAYKRCVRRDSDTAIALIARRHTSKELAAANFRTGCMLFRVQLSQMDPAGHIADWYTLRQVKKTQVYVCSRHAVLGSGFSTCNEAMSV